MIDDLVYLIEVDGLVADARRAVHRQPLSSIVTPNVITSGQSSLQFQEVDERAEK